ncbi:precorrin-3B synthase [Dongia rigui]|uniref:Precorrin-3B synthase n=1 Tax=Dongia rigui TaxID=940149 RepID=A0ABU5DZT8_9PROT|nr:precorrin-3B synthase [Dongia rigui]MDY0872847.1 precorrin-3B synthase [Dongia rigui]
MIQSDRRFACPGLYRIVPSQDGGICRIKLPFGRLNAAQMRALAKLAAAHGLPEIEVTNRANVQIRGVHDGADDALIAGLVDAGLAPKSSGADDVRNVMVSPFIGLDPNAIFDVSDLARRVLARLENETHYHVLSPKFSIQIDGGEEIAMLQHPNDIWLSAMADGRFAFGFAGVPGERTAGAVASGDAEAALFTLLDHFTAKIGQLNAKGDKITRMRHLLVDETPADLAARLTCRVTPADAWQRAAAMPQGHIGARRQADGRFILGAVPLLGRLGQEMMLGLADLAHRFSGSEIRLTPWQSVMLPSMTEDALEEAVAALEELDFITRPDRTLAATLTCAGSAGCKSGLADTKADARHLANEIDGWGQPVFGIHLTGCAKSCAAPRPAPYTLLGLRPGHYDVFAQSDAPVGDTAKTGLGELLGHDVTIEQAARLLMQREKA